MPLIANRGSSDGSNLSSCASLNASRPARSWAAGPDDERDFFQLVRRPSGLCRGPRHCHPRYQVSSPAAWHHLPLRNLACSGRAYHLFGIWSDWLRVRVMGYSDWLALGQGKGCSDWVGVRVTVRFFWSRTRYKPTFSSNIWDATLTYPVPSL